MDVPSGLGVRGLGLWEKLSSGDVTRDALVLEACRLADRLDELDSVIQGKGVLNLMQFRVLDREVTDERLEINVEVKFQNVLSEARQQALAFTSVLKALAAGDAPAAKVVPATASSAGAPSNVTPLDRVRQKLTK